MIQNGVYEQVKEDFDRLAREGYDLFGVFLYGSQNYGLDHSKSDIDTYAIYFSHSSHSFREKIYFRRTQNGTITPIHINVFLSGLYSQEKKALELLFSKACCVNKIYQSIYASLLANKEKIARARPRENLKRLLLYAENELMLANKLHIDKMKRVANVKRVQYLAEKYVGSEPYEECLQVSPLEKEELINIKTLWNWPVEEQIKAIEESVSVIRGLVQSWEAPTDNLDILSRVQGYFDERNI